MHNVDEGRLAMPSPGLGRLWLADGAGVRCGIAKRQSRDAALPLWTVVEPCHADHVRHVGVSIARPCSLGWRARLLRMSSHALPRCSLSLCLRGIRLSLRPSPPTDGAPHAAADIPSNPATRGPMEACGGREETQSSDNLYIV